jgi:hypothetical protein
MGKDDVPPHVPHKEGGMDASGYGVLVGICSEGSLQPATVEEFLRRIVTEVGERCLAAGARAIGHIKCYLKADQGHAKADIVWLKQGAFVEVQLERPITRGSLVINSIILDLSEDEIERITIEVLERILGEYGVSLRKL